MHSPVNQGSGIGGVFSVIYSGQQVRTQAEAGRGGSVLHISQGRTAGCHTAAPTEAHTSVTEQTGTPGWSVSRTRDAGSQGRSNQVRL